jgi:hypothetical protein
MLQSALQVYEKLDCCIKPKACNSVFGLYLYKSLLWVIMGMSARHSILQSKLYREKAVISMLFYICKLTHLIFHTYGLSNCDWKKYLSLSFSAELEMPTIMFCYKLKKEVRYFLKVCF